MFGSGYFLRGMQVVSEGAGYSNWVFSFLSNLKEAFYDTSTPLLIKSYVCMFNVYGNISSTAYILNALTLDAGAADRRVLVHAPLRHSHRDHSVVDTWVRGVEGAIAIAERDLAVVGAISAERFPVWVR